MIQIRPFHSADLSAAAAIERLVYPEPWSEGVFEEELAAASRSYLAAEEDDQLIGYAGIALLGDDAHVTTITVAADRRGQGIGTRLMLALVEEAVGSGAENLTLEVRMSNRIAQRLYRRFGLAPVGVRKRYYGSEDALVMWAHGIAEPEYRARLATIREVVS